MLQSAMEWFNQATLIQKIILICLGFIIVRTLWQMYQSKNGKNGNIGVESMKNTRSGQNKKGPKGGLVMFFATWCPHCKDMMPTWAKLNSKFNGSNLKVVKIDGDKRSDLKKTHGVDGFPTIKYLPNGLSSNKGSVEYSGDRSFESLVQFVQKNT